MDSEHKRLKEAADKLLEGPTDEPQIELTGEWESGLYCGLEDQGMQGDAYAACHYGFQEGVGRALEWAQGVIIEALEG